MLTEVTAGRYRVRGVSVGGIYTSLHVPELNVLFDVGIALRSTAGVGHIFLSHAHADHVGALVGLLGIRGLMHKPPPRVYMPKAVVADLQAALASMSKLQRYPLDIEAVPLQPGDEVQLNGSLHVRAFPTFHPVPSLGYQMIRRVTKLKPAYLGVPGKEIAKRRAAGEDLFFQHDNLELAYATDTLIRVLDETPSLLKSRVLIMECSFLDSRKRLRDSRAGCHIHLDEVLERAQDFQNDHLVLMHFSQIYSPREARRVLAERCPEELLSRIVPFAPQKQPWPG